MSDFATSASTLANSADDSDSRDMQTDSQSVAQVKTDLGLFEDADSLSAEDLNNLAMLDPALLSEKEIAQAAQNQFDHAVQFLRHDLLRISGDIDEADRFLRDNHTSEPLADAYAARLIAAERWQDLLDFVDLVLRDKPNQVTMMFPEEVVPTSGRRFARPLWKRWDAATNWLPCIRNAWMIRMIQYRAQSSETPRLVESAVVPIPPLTGTILRPRAFRRPFPSTEWRKTPVRGNKKGPSGNRWGSTRRSIS